jgi:hypothetical protein
MAGERDEQQGSGWGAQNSDEEQAAKGGRAHSQRWDARDDERGTFVDNDGCELASLTD